MRITQYPGGPLRPGWFALLCAAATGVTFLVVAVTR